MNPPSQERTLTIHQPHASLVAVGAKTIETRSWPTSYRGPLLIHAGKHPLRDRITLGPFDFEPADPRGRIHPNHDSERPARMYASRTMTKPEAARYRVGIASWLPLPLGAVVASCQLIDCVPMYDGTDRSLVDLATVAPCVSWDGDCGLYLFRTAGLTENEQIDDQLPFGDFTPGRYAWLLGDVKPTTERCPRCWDAQPFDVTDDGLDAPDSARVEYGPVGWWYERQATCWWPDLCLSCRGDGRLLASHHDLSTLAMRGRQGLWTPKPDDWNHRG